MATVADKAELLGKFFDEATRGLSGDRDDISMLLLERSDGASHFDDSAPARNRAPVEPVQATPDADTVQPHLLKGAEDGHAFIAIVGSITWLCSQALLDSANDLLAGEDALTLDLQRCEHMDSTCLGTLHEIVTSHPEAVELQGVSEDVRKLFDELSMSAVLAHIRDETRAVPENLEVIESANLSPRQQGERILSAHETLASISEANQEQFHAVVESLRADLPAGE
jgi:ABC-type transporter Mla MlaB component